MAFKLYSVLGSTQNRCRLVRPEPLRFSGAKGLVSRHVQALGALSEERWIASDELWLDQYVPGETLSPRWIVFEQVEDDWLRLSRLTAIHGVNHGDRTELLLQLSPLDVVQSVPDLVVDVDIPAEGRTWSEGVALDGSYRRPHAPWSWCERALNVGATVLAPR